MVLRRRINALTASSVHYELCVIYQGWENAFFEDNEAMGEVQTPPVATGQSNADCTCTALFKLCFKELCASYLQWERLED